MQCSSYCHDRPKNSILILICIVLVVALSGCTQSVRKVSYINDDSAAFLAQSSSEDVLPLQGKSAQDLVTAGFIYLANRNLKIAELHFATAINKDPQMVDAYIGLGRAELLKGNYSGALVGFTKARKLKPDSVPALVGEAQALRLDGKLNAAIKKINEAMMYAPEDIDVL